MKKRIILIISLCLNAGLVAAYFTVNRPPAPPVTTEETSAPAEKTTTRVKQSVAETVVVTKDFNWATVEAEDYKKYIANLRAIGCPEETIADIIIADVNKLYGSRMAALRTSGADFKFWQVENRDTRTMDRERQAKLRELEQEKRALIKELLGIDLDQELARWSGREDGDAWRYAFLSPEKQEQMRTLQDKYRELERSLRAEGGGPETRAKMLALRAQQEAEMAQLLTPTEFQEYQLRNSFTARNMRENLGLFEPSESEFREIFNLRKTFDDQYGFLRGGGDDATREQRRAAEQQLDEQLKAMLGEQRYKEYQMAQDNRYRDIYNFAQENSVSTAAAQQVYDLRVAAEEERNRLRNNSSLSAEQREVELAKLALNTSQALNTVLGANVSQSYLESDGRWVTRLANVENNQRGGGGGGDAGNRRVRRGGPGGP